MKLISLFMLKARVPTYGMMSTCYARTTAGTAGERVKPDVSQMFVVRTNAQTKVLSHSLMQLIHQFAMSFSRCVVIGI